MDTLAIYSYIFTMEYYLTTKKNEALPLVTTWLDLKSITLSEISQMEKALYHIISLTIESENETKQNK